MLFSQRVSILNLIDLSRNVLVCVQIPFSDQLQWTGLEFDALQLGADLVHSPLQHDLQLRCFVKHHLSEQEGSDTHLPSADEKDYVAAAQAHACGVAGDALTLFNTAKTDCILEENSGSTVCSSDRCNVLVEAAHSTTNASTSNPALSSVQSHHGVVHHGELRLEGWKFYNESLFILLSALMC